MKWNKYTLTTTSEAEDLISSMMMDAGIEGIEIEDKVPLSDSEKAQMFVDILPDAPADDGVARISFYLEPDQDNAAVLAAVQQGLDEIRSWGVDVGAGTIEASQTEDKDWINNWKEYFHQFYVDDILIKPSWEETKPEDQDKLLIQIDPGTAFGTGMHETTQLCIRQIRKYLTGDTELLDIGTGSGILAIAALKLGAAQAEGVDIDPVAVRTAGENAALNGVADRLTVLVGDLSDKASGQYQIITANIVANAIMALAPAVPGLMAEGGVFIASGIIDTRKEEVIAALQAAGLKVQEVKEKRGWECIVCTKA